MRCRNNTLNIRTFRTTEITSTYCEHYFRNLKHDLLDISRAQGKENKEVPNQPLKTS